VITSLEDKLDAVAAGIPLVEGDLDAVMARGHRRGRRRLVMSSVTVTAMVLVGTWAGIGVLSHRDTSSPLDRSSSLTTTSSPPTTKFTSTREWHEQGARMTASKRAVAADPNGMYAGVIAKQASWGAYRSEPVDVMGPGEYTLLFGPVGNDFGPEGNDYGAIHPNFATHGPPDARFQHQRILPQGYTTKDTGRYFVMTMTVPLEEFQEPYPGFEMWIA
jgi:hypothetical protein